MCVAKKYVNSYVILRLYYTGKDILKFYGEEDKGANAKD